MERKASPSCADWVIRSATPGSVERIEAWFGGHGYDPHRHDTYSIGRTLAGVQSFHYKGALCHGVPGNTLVLHPDELHDGMAGTDIGFRYRMAYIDPSLIQNVLGGEPLPFIAGGMSRDPRLYRASEAFVQALDHPLETLEEQDAVYDLAMALVQSAASPAAANAWTTARPSAPGRSSWSTLTTASRWKCSSRPAGVSNGACHGTSEPFTAPAHTVLSRYDAWTVFAG